MIFPKETVQLLFDWINICMLIMPYFAFIRWRITHFQIKISRYTSWWYQFSCSEKCTPYSITRPGWDVNTRSMQKYKFDKIWFGSSFNCCSPNWDVIVSILEPSSIAFIPISWLSIEVTKDNYQIRVFVSNHI